MPGLFITSPTKGGQISPSDLPPPPYQRARTLIILSLSLVIFLFHIYTAAFGLFSVTIQRSVHWCLMGCLLFITVGPPVGRRAAKPLSLLNIVCILALVSATVYLAMHWQEMAERVMPPGTAELVFGGLLILATLEAARKSSGIALPLVAVIFLLYAMAGPLMPDVLKHRGYSVSRLIAYLFSTSSGIYGIPLGVSATYITLFVFFGAFLNASGAGKLLMECSLALTGKSMGGAAKTAVVASALMGTMSGSPIANAVTTGTVTIPLMRQSGFERNFACSVEAVASTGGMIMPPVMGAAAFLMAEYLNTDYATLMQAAFLPALVYFISIYFTVDFYSRKHNIGGTDIGTGHVFETFKKTWHLLIPIVCLICFLLARYSPMTAVARSLLILIAVSWLRKETRLTPSRCLAAIEEGARGAVTVAAACATSGIILGVISLTGVGSSVSSATFAHFAGFLPGALISAMIISLVLGMGLPATAVYLILATLVAPSLVHLGVPPLAAHMFVFYFGIISTITPPVALTAYAAAAVGGGDPVRVGAKAFILGIAAYCIPFILVYDPAIMLTGSITAALLRFAICIAAVHAMALASVGFFRIQISPFCRSLSAFAGFLLITPSPYTDFLGLALLAFVHIMHHRPKDVRHRER